MKLLLSLLMCLLLSGCSAPADSPTVPAEAQGISREVSANLQKQYGSVVEAVSLPFEHVQQLWHTDVGILLQSEQELMLLNEAFRPITSCTLDFPALVAASGQTISAFDPESQQLLLLTSSLEEIRHITLPPEMTGHPLVTQDGNAVFYCTGQGIYHWDFTSGIRRRVRESACAEQSLVGLHQEDTVLQFRLEDRDLFLDARSGQLLQEVPAPVQLATTADDYYCRFSSGAVQNLVFGQEATEPQALFPAAAHAEAFFLPGIHSAVTLENGSEDTYLLSCYDLEKGELRDTLTLYHKPKATVSHRDGSILLLVQDNGQDALLKWHPGTSAAGGRNYTEPYYTADHPDHTGLSLCRDYANTLSEEYGLEILIWKEAAATEPWDYTFQPEHRYPVLLRQLQALEACLSRYPKEVLAQSASHFDSLKLCLVQSIHGIAGENSLNTATGIQFLNGSDAHVVLAAGPYLEQALYHELFHVMEIHILSNSKELDRWKELNPAGFSYDLDHGSNARRNSGIYLENGTRAFVDTYSMSFPKEDRARIFEYAMLPDMAHLFRSEIMQRKLNALCRGIRDAYGLKKHPDTFPWEQYLK